jgi:hypothetical protein
MFIPPQGLRHAAVLLLTRGARAVPADASRDSVGDALAALAHGLAALADDMRAAPESADWLLAEYTRTVKQMPHGFDRDAANAMAATILSRVSLRTPTVELRDLFLVSNPRKIGCRLRAAGHRLAKRRVSVAFPGEYEVSTCEQLVAALQHGLEHHRAGAVLWTDLFERRRCELTLPDVDRVRVLRHFGPRRQPRWQIGCASSGSEMLRNKSAHPLKCLRRHFTAFISQIPAFCLH